MIRGYYWADFGIERDTLPAPAPEPSSPKTTEERLAEERADGMNCWACGEWCPKAEPNQADGKTMVCFPCRSNPWRPGIRRR